jgi:hypothetical protein
MPTCRSGKPSPCTVPFPGFGGRREDLYHPWRVQTREGEIGVFFRDRELSDLIGFTFQRVESAQAVKGFMNRLHEIRKGLKTEDAVIPVILDGENAWEHYPNNGRDFLDRLYDALESDEAVSTVTLDQAAEQCEWRELTGVVPGSWIGGRLSTWVGHPEKNRAWELVCRTRERLAAVLPDLDEDLREKAREQVLIGEGSDWFWWYGDDHFTTLASRFDELFRLHLINGFRYAGLEAVPELLEPVRRDEHPRGHLRVPTDVITPVLDGRITHYFEWLHAGHFDLGLDRGAMHRSDPVLRDLHYGFDAGCLYLMLETSGDFSRRAEGLILEIETSAPRKVVFSLDISKGGMTLPEGSGHAAGLEGVAGKVAEIRLPLDLLGAVPGQDVLMSFTLLKDGVPVEKAPMFSLVKISVPEDYDLEYWIV